MKLLTKRFMQAGLGAAVALSMLPAAYAQDADSGERISRTGMDSVTVTGTKRDEESQTVPIAISAISSQQLANTFRTDIWAVSDLAPNVTLTQMAGFRAVAGGIRGTGANSILVTQDTSVPVIVDEFALNSVQAQFVELFDVESIEIYRGPQGTLFGKNSTGGAIVINTKRPILNEFSADAEFQLGQFDSNNGLLAKARLAINIPVVEDKLAFRISLIQDYDQGYYKGTKAATTGFFDDNAGGLVDVGPGGFPNNVPVYGGAVEDGGTGCGVSCGDIWPTWLDTTAQRPDNKRIGGTDVLAGNFKALWTPTDNYEALFKFSILRDDSESMPAVNDSPRFGEVDPFDGQTGMLVPLLGFGGIPATGGDPLNTAVDNQCAGGNTKGLCIPSGHKVHAEEYHLHQTLTMDTMTLKLLTGYRTHKESLPSTYTGEAFNSLFDANRSLERDQLQLELRAVSNYDGPFNFVAGAAYSQDNVDMRAIATLGFLGLLSAEYGPTEFPALDDDGNPTFDEDTGDPLFVFAPVLDADGRINLPQNRFNDPGTGSAKQDRESWAIYADGTFELTDTLRLTGGIRYTMDKKHYERFNNPGGACTQFSPVGDIIGLDPDGEDGPLPAADATLANCLPGGPMTAIDGFSSSISRAGITSAEYDLRERPLPDSSYALQFIGDDSWDKVTWRAVLDWQFDEDAMAYLSYSTGFISGGFTETCSTEFSCQPYQPETNWNLELGLKAQFADGQVQTNLALFYTRFDDLLRSQVVPFTDSVGNTSQETINFNAGTSEVYGIEAEVVWLATENLRIDLTGAYTQHKYVEFEVDAGRADENGDPIGIEDLSHLTVPFSPKWQFSAGITYDQAMGNGGSIVYNTTVHYQSEVELSVFNSLYTQMESRFLWDANMTWRDAEEKYRVTLYGKNLLDERYRTGSNSVSILWNMTNYGRPREYGIDVGFYF
jgi:iron complex outermembrane receptor protein